MRDNEDLGIMARLLVAAPIGWLLAFTAIVAFVAIHEMSRAAHAITAITQ